MRHELQKTSLCARSVMVLLEDAAKYVPRTKQAFLQARKPKIRKIVRQLAPPQQTTTDFLIDVLSSLITLRCSSCSLPSQITPVLPIRTWNRQQAHSIVARQSVLHKTIKSIVAPNHGAVISALFTFCSIRPCASVAGGVSRPRSGALAVPRRLRNA